MKDRKQGKNNEHSLPEGAVKVEKPNVTFEDVIGLEETKKEILDTLKEKKAILLYGPPGCGKTFIATAVAGELKKTLISTKRFDLIDQIVGITEKNVHLVFELAKKKAPCIILFENETSVTDNKNKQYVKMSINVMLYEMDLIESNNENVFVIITTNAPWDIDPFLIKTNYFSKIYIPEPDFRVRAEILKVYSKDLNLNKNIHFERLASATEGYSIEDLNEIIRSLKEMKGQKLITYHDLIDAIHRKRNSLTDWYPKAKERIAILKKPTIITGKCSPYISDYRITKDDEESFKKIFDAVNSKSSVLYRIKLFFVKYFNLALAMIPA